jgi:hypothetical protein
MITGQWFYRPDEAEKKGGGSWQSNDTRELFYSFHRDDVPAESVMHKCVVHFVPIHKQIPTRKQYPGFIVQKVYDTDEMKLWKLTDKDYEDGNQQEIDELVQKTLQRLGDLPDIETDEAPTDHEDLMRSKRILKKKSISHLDVSREDETSRKSFQHLKPETPGSTSEHYRILVKFNALTGDTHRDKGLVMLLQNVQYLFDTDDIRKKKDKCSDNSDAINNGSKNKSSEIANESKDKVLKVLLDVSGCGCDLLCGFIYICHNLLLFSLFLEGYNEFSIYHSTLQNSKSFVWPDVAVPAVVALEKASHDTFSSDYQKYSQKLRQLAFNLKVGSYFLTWIVNLKCVNLRLLLFKFSNEFKQCVRFSAWIHIIYGVMQSC